MDMREEIPNTLKQGLIIPSSRVQFGGSRPSPAGYRLRLMLPSTQENTPATKFFHWAEGCVVYSEGLSHISYSFIDSNSHEA